MHAQCFQPHQHFFTVAFQEKRHAEPKKRKSNDKETNDIKDSESSKSVKKHKKVDGNNESVRPDNKHLDIFEIEAKKPEGSTDLSVLDNSESVTKKSVVDPPKRCDEKLLKISAEDGGSSPEEGEYSSSEAENISNSDDSGSSDSDGNIKIGLIFVLFGVGVCMIMN